MALANYSDLQASILSFLNRNDSGIPVTDFIDLAEAELNARVRVRQNMTTAALVLTSGTSTVALPAGCLEEVELNYTASNDEISRGSFNDIDRARGAGLSSKPTAYAISGTDLVFDCLSDATYALTLRYYAAWDISADSTNWLLTTHPDAYLFGALAEANAWLGDAAQSEYARGRRNMAIERALTADSRTRGAPLRVDAALFKPGRFNIVTG